MSKVDENNPLYLPFVSPYLCLPIRTLEKVLEARKLRESKGETLV